FIAQQPQVDMLASDAATQWFNDGFQGWRITNGVLEAVGPEASATKNALMGVPKLNQWRDFQLEGELEMAKGHAELYLRYLRQAANAVGPVRLNVGTGEDEIPPGKRVAFV